MDVIKRINALMDERGWSPYKLAQKSGLSTSTIANIYRRNSVPSLATIEILCQAFGISLSQFFTENDSCVPLTAEQKALFDKWVILTPSQKRLIENLISEFK